MQQKAEFAPLTEESETGSCEFMFSGTDNVYELSACLRTHATKGHWFSSISKVFHNMCHLESCSGECSTGINYLAKNKCPRPFLGLAQIFAGGFAAVKALAGLGASQQIVQPSQ